MYSLAELDAISAVARASGISVHMDGARFANGLEALGCSPADATWRRGVDVLSFGGTKNGCLAAEAVIFFKRELVGGSDFRLRLKRSGHLWSKMRFLSAQMIGYLGEPAALADAPWRRRARHANAMAQRLAEGIAELASAAGRAEEVRILQSVQTNEVFLTLPEAVLSGVFSDGHACLDIGALSDTARRGELLRCVCCWATTPQEVDAFLRSVARHTEAIRARL